MKRTVLVVGGGVAGLTAAVRLVDAGFGVRLFEKRAIVGGRAYSYRAREAGHLVDNGQHLMMGCYEATLGLLERIGATAAVERRRLAVDLAEPGGGAASFGCAPLPAPLHLLVGALGYRHLRPAERASLLTAGGRLVFRHLRGALAGKTVAEALVELRQGDRARRAFWDPLAIAVLNELPGEASAELFAEVLRRVFAGRASASDLLLPASGLSELFARPACRAIENGGGSVEVGQGVRRLDFLGERLKGVRLANGAAVDADAVVLAVPPTKVADLLPEALRGEPPFAGLVHLRPAPIVSVHVWLERPVATPRMLGFLEGPLQWLFTPPMQPDRGRYVTLVASGAYDLVEQEPRVVEEEARRALARYVPQAAGAWSDVLVVKERSATFAASPAEQPHRPAAATPIPNLFLAGDWTATGLPATIESAVTSGNRATEALIQHKTGRDLFAREPRALGQSEAACSRFARRFLESSKEG